jgi:hypothetical protein
VGQRAAQRSTRQSVRESARDSHHEVATNSGPEQRSGYKVAGPENSAALMSKVSTLFVPLSNILRNDLCLKGHALRHLVLSVTVCASVIHAGV